MTLVDKLADEVVTDFAKHGVWMTIPQRKVLWALIVKRIKPLVPVQPSLPFSEVDERVNAEQAAEILQLLKARGSNGVTNAELAAIALQYNARIFELRRPPHNYKITCERTGRTSVFRLVPKDRGCENEN